MKNQGKQAAKDYDAARNAIGETGRITGHASIAVGAAGIAFPLALPVTTPVSLGLGMVSTASNTFGTVMDYGSGNIEDALFNGASVAVDTGHDVIRQSILTTTLNLAPPQVKAGATTGLLFLDAMSNEIFYQAGKK